MQGYKILEFLVPCSVSMFTESCLWTWSDPWFLRILLLNVYSRVAFFCSSCLYFLNQMPDIFPWAYLPHSLLCRDDTKGQVPFILRLQGHLATRWVSCKHSHAWKRNLKPKINGYISTVKSNIFLKHLFLLPGKI